MNPTFKRDESGVHVSVKRMEKYVMAPCANCAGRGFIPLVPQMLRQPIRAGVSLAPPWQRKTTSKRCHKCRGAGESEQRLVSYDGISWQMDQHKARRRLQSAINLKGKRWAKQKEKQLDVATNKHAEKRKPESTLIQVDHHGSPFLGKAKGKNQKYKRNLKRKKEREVKIMRPVHFHRCHGERFSCSCDTPWKKRRCGGQYCLHATMAEEMLKTAVR